MKLIYIANVRIPTEKAHGIQIMKMCEAFAAQGLSVELVVPRRLNSIKKDPFDYYGVNKTFQIKKLFCLDFISFGFGKIGFWIENFSFAKIAAAYVLLKKPDVIYSREIMPLFFLSFFKKNIFWESHRGEFNFMVKRLAEKCRGIIVITEGLKNFYTEKGINAQKILVAPDAVDLEKFNINISEEEARKKIDLPLGKKIVLYTGHLYEWKGAHILAEAAKHLGEDCLIVFVGGTEKDVTEFKNRNKILKNISVLGHKSYSEIPYYLKSADVLILPNSAKEEISRSYTSPMKLFEYMASGVPIVASGLQSIKEILNEENSALVEPDNPQLLAIEIKKVLENKDFAEKISDQAFRDSQNYTWEKRAENILNFIKTFL